MENEQERRGTKRVAFLIDLLDRVAGDPCTDGTQTRVGPVVIRELPSLRMQPRHVLESARLLWEPFEEEPASQRRVRPAQGDRVPRELDQVLLVVAQVPVVPGNLVILRVGVV